MIAFRVVGRVQGVGFRSGTARLATVLGLDGWVRNVGDGSVQGRIAGDSAAIDAFFQRLAGVSARARIDTLQRKDVTDEEAVPGFEVLGTVPGPTPDWG